MISDIIKMLETLTGPDPEVDRYIHGHFDLPIREILPDKPLLINSYTYSVDAATTLAERVFSQVRIMSEKDFDGTGWASVQVNNKRFMADGATPAIALCIAILEAKEKQDALL